MQTPSLAQFFFSLLGVLLLVLVSRAFVLWFFGINKLIAKLEGISQKLGDDPVLREARESFPAVALRSIRSRLGKEK